MSATSHSLLDRLKNRHDSQAWRQWSAVYEPWLRGWLRRHRLQPADSDDLLQNILVVVSEKLPDFIHNGRPSAFRAWLRTILINQVRYFWRAQRQLPDQPADSLAWLDLLADPSSELSRQWEIEHDRQLVRRLLAIVQPEFQPRTWEVFRLLILDDRPAAEVARCCNMELNAVYVAKSRVLARLRQELAGLLEI